LSDLQFFREVRFWDDLFYSLRDSSIFFKQNLLDDLDKMDLTEKQRLFRALIEWSGNNPEFIFKFSVACCEHFPLKNYPSFNLLISLYLSSYRNDPEFLAHLIALFQRDPTLLYKILQLCSSQNLMIMNKIVFQKTIPNSGSLFQKSLAELLYLVSQCSFYFKRFLTNVYHEFPHYACLIPEPDRFAKECERILRHLPHEKSLERKKKMLGDYYDLKFLELGLKTFRGLAVQEINRQFTDFATRYMQALFRICVREVSVRERWRRRVVKNLAIYASGGNGREQAFDDDFDLLIISDYEQPAELQFYREIIAAMNTEMIKRGTLPHFRFSHHFGEYICPLPELKDLFLSSYPESFIDKSQVLESRLLIGPASLHRKFYREILQKAIFARPQEFIANMIREIRQRHGSDTFFREKCANIKECTGGLRDIEMIILIYKVLYRLSETNPYLLMETFCQKNREHRDDWRRLKSSLMFLQRFRYVYRLSVAAEDHIYPENLHFVASRLNPYLEAGEEGSQWLWQQFIYHRKEAWHSIRKLIRALD